MRDDRLKWVAFDLDQPILRGGFNIQPVNMDRLSLRSGPSVRAQSELPLVGWPVPPDSDAYTIVLRRDRVLCVNGDERQEGWDTAKACFISDATDLYLTYEISGPKAFSVLQRGTEISLASPSRTALRRLWGIDVILYKLPDQNHFRLHVERGLAPGLLQHMASVTQIAD